jgi:predicted SAM-dependent methyltransferase
MYKKVKQFVYKRLIPFMSIWKRLRLYFYLIKQKDIKLIVGAGPTKYKGWFSTDIATLDVTNENHFNRYFKNKKINRILAEHVLEHLSTSDLIAMGKNFFKYSTENVNIRIAVPDGYHPDKTYIEYVRPGGIGEGADDHKHLFTYISLSQLFESFGFKTKLVDFWDEKSIFHNNYSNDDKGFIIRSFLNDKRNSDGKPHYTSLIIDFHK